MKQLIALLSVCVLAQSALAANDHSKVDTTGLTAWYPFSGNAGDSSGHGHDGTVNGATLCDDRFGNPNSAYLFDNSDLIRLTTPQALGMYDHDFTVAAWINGTSYTGDRGILASNSGGNSSWLWLMVRSARPLLAFYNNDTYARTATLLQAGSWFHVVFRYAKGIGEQAIFINGVLDTAGTGHAAFNGYDTLNIGRCYNGSFAGVIDDVCIYSRALTATEIQKLYDSDVPILIAPINNAIVYGHSANLLWHAVDSAVSCRVQVSADSTFASSGSNQLVAAPDTTAIAAGLISSTYFWRVKAYLPSDSTRWSLTAKFQVDTTNGLVAYYPFSGNADDSSGHGHDGTVHGAALCADRFGNPDKAYSFNGSDQYIQIPYSAELTPSNRMTVSAWVKADNWGVLPYSNYIVQAEQSNGRGFTLRGGNTTVEFTFLGSGSAHVAQTPANTLHAGTWYHLAGVYDGTAARIYVNSNLQASAAYSGAIDQSTGDLFIGTSYNLFRYFDGEIDEVRIYNRALSQAEIDSLYGTPVSLTAPQLISPADSANYSIPSWPTFRWHRVDSAAYYKFQLDGVDACTLTDTAYTPVALAWAGQYTWRVVACQGIYTRPSVDRHFTIAIPHLIAPRNDTIFNSINTPTFLWNEADSVSYYRLLVANDPSFTSTIIDHSLADTAYMELSPLGDGHYYWHVASLRGGIWYESNTQHFSVNVYSGVAGEPVMAVAPRFSLDNPSPNPARDHTVIKYQLPVRSMIKLAVYNGAGQRVRTLFDGQQNDGGHTASWDLKDNKGRAVSTGIYFIRLSTGSQQVTGKLTVIR